ncbi:hypothetical protein MUDAN_DOGOELCO_00471 [Lactiplantibacillus mudanjiangensis]|uniref:IclR family transcriptional regulator n=1 Tax=Lactiplantibacillus mudanjiangensis TaxID=1296538 RepID=UPI0010148C13|nr:IclR family transcriptional regulator C-terminal domain-containing protein [Lactiplantibacillus mudanjiangensis]VDG30970.1 hypothetical protein MUDAN_DOGOELCO_00471 [Lactiplantibacillus mudanjiangensis]
MSQYLSGTLAKAFKILTYLDQQPTATLTTIATALNYNKTTAFRLLASLVELGYVTKQAQTYALSTRQQALIQFNNPRLNWVATSIMRQITQPYQVSAYIGILTGPDVVITQVVDYQGDLAEYAKIGSAAPINESALGKCIAAYLPTTQQQALSHQLNSAATKYTLTDQVGFLQNLKIIHDQGYALDDEESSFGIRCLAVPIIKNDQVIAALGVAGSLDRMQRRNLKRLAQVLTQCSQTIALQF